MGRNTKLRNSGQNMSYSLEQLKEVAKCKKDPVYFCRNYVYIKHPSRGRILFDLYDYQEDMIRNYQKYKYNIVLSARQTGKTETTAAYLLWYAMYHDEKTILIASNKATNAMGIMQRIQEAYEELPHWLKPGIDENNWNKHKSQFENRSVITSEATSTTTGRGGSVSLIYCDEFAFVPYNIQKDFWQSIYPTLTEGEGLIISSTPNGDSDLFAETWRKADLETDASELQQEEAEVDEDEAVVKFHAKWIKWDMPPGRDEAFKREKMHILGERAWLQEYECEFLGGTGTLLDNKELIKLEEKIKESGQNVLFRVKDVPFFASIKAGGKYILGIDPSTGTGQDYTVMELFEFPSMEQVSEYRVNNSRPAEIYTKMRKLIQFLTNADCEVYFSIESNGVGQGLIALWENDQDFPEKTEMFHDEGKDKYGFFTTDAIKLDIATKLKLLFETKNITLHSTVLIKELKNFVRKGRSYQAREGMTDDCVMATIIAIRVLAALAESNDEAHEKLYPVAISGGDEWTENEIEIIDGESDDYMPFII